MKPPPLPCRRCNSAIEAEDLRCPVCCQAVPAAAQESGTKIDVQVLRCTSCSAAMTYHAGRQASHCAFCGGVQKLEEQLDPEEQTEKHLPFTIDRTRATDVYRQWVSKQGFFRPLDLASSAQLESLRAIWWPGWVVDAKAIVTWTADSDAGAKLAKWAPHAGEVQTEFSRLVIPATRGLSPAESSGLILTYNLEGSIPPYTGVDQEIVVERFEMPRSCARSHIVKSIQRLAEARIQAEQIPGTRSRNCHTSVHLRGLVTQRIAFPAYVIAYKYRGRLYRTVISGQDPTGVIGELPRSLLKLGLTIAFALLSIIAILFWLLGFAR